MPEANIQALVVQDLDHWPNALLPKLRCGHTSKRAITKEERAIIAFCSTLLVYCYRQGPRGLTIVQLLEL